MKETSNPHQASIEALVYKRSSSSLADLFPESFIPEPLESSPTNQIRFIDLFAGMGGIRLGFEQAAQELKIETRCVFTSEIKAHAIKALQQNFAGEPIAGDITKIPSEAIPDFDILLGGFPCQAFSSAGKREGFVDTRGTLFFEIERILRDKKPRGFLLENVEGLVNHDKQDASQPIGRTLSTILNHLEGLGYQICWGVLNASDFGIPQERKRIYITGTLQQAPQLPAPSFKSQPLSHVLESGLPTSESDIAQMLLARFHPEQLFGRSIKDKRGGEDNIHSWDIGLKGEVTDSQRSLLNKLLKERRKKKWAQEYGIEWMDGMPLSLEQIKTFESSPTLEEDLQHLVNLGYLKREYPKRLVSEETPLGRRTYRIQDQKLPLGYNIITGKLSFPISKILDPRGYAPTLVATDMEKLYVVDGNGLRPLSIREGLRLSGYPDTYRLDNISKRSAYDLLGNTVAVPVIKAVAKELLHTL